eukprot:Gb_22215 [translate_table: standard]
MVGMAFVETKIKTQIQLQNSFGFIQFSMSIKRNLVDNINVIDPLLLHESLIMMTTIGIGYVDYSSIKFSWHNIVRQSPCIVKTVEGHAEVMEWEASHAEDSCSPSIFIVKGNNEVGNLSPVVFAIISLLYITFGGDMDFPLVLLCF